MRSSRSAILALLLLATTAQASGLNLSWDRCYGDGAPVVNKTFACDRNSGSEVFVASFILAAPISPLRLVEVAFDLQSPSGTALPPWWAYTTSNSCRLNQMTIDGAPPLPGGNCQGWVPGLIAPFDLSRYDFQSPTPDLARLVVSAGGGNAALLAGTEYLACAIHLSHVRTVGPDACGGCLDPVAITLSQLRVAQAGPIPPPDQLLSVAAGGNVVVWQPGRPTAARASTWSAVKALYR